MKRICFVMTEASQFNILCRGQLEYFSSQPNLEVTLVCGGNEIDIDKLKQRNVGNVYIVPLVRKPSIFIDLLSLIQLFWFFLFNRFDVVVYSTPKALLIGSIASFMAFQKKRIALIRGRAYENYSGSKRKIFEFLDKLCLFISHKTLFIAESLRLQYIEEGLTKAVDSYVLGTGSSNGVDVLKFKPELNKIDDPIFRIIVIGRVCIDKGVVDVYEVLKDIEAKNIHFSIVGKIDDEEARKYLDLILKEFSYTTYYDHIDDPSKVFGQSDLHLFLSHRDGFGNVAIEAASCNVPTFSYDIVGLKDSVNHNISGIRFNFGDTHSVAKAINRAAEDKQAFRQKFLESRTWVLENFENEKVWKNYLDFYIAE